MKMTLEQYIQNPMGKNNGVFTGYMREAAKSSYTDKFNKLMLREHGNVYYKLFKNEKLNKYYMYIKVPSEVVRKFYYDVVLEFSTDSDVKEAGRNLLKYNVKFFSNDPSFVYTYAYVFKRDSLLINELQSKMSKIALSESPKIKNPKKEVGYIKSLYFAYLIIKAKNLNSLTKFDTECTEIDWGWLNNNVENADSKIKKRQDAGNKLSPKKPINKTTQKVNGNLNRDNNSLKVKSSGKIGGTKKSSKISSIKTIKSIKRK